MPKTYLHLKDLFTKGQFGPVKPGMTMEEVEALIGEPTLEWREPGKGLYALCL